MSNITHPLKVGTKVRYLSPRCPCSGKKYEITEGAITQVAKNGPNYRYLFHKEPRAIPSEAVIKIL